MQAPILNCDLHDYLEIACLFELTVELQLVDGTSLTGQLITIATHSAIEYLQVRPSHQIYHIEIPVLSLALMTALTKNLHFYSIRFNEI